MQGDGGVEVRQGVRAEREVQGGQVHTRGRVALYGVLVSFVGRLLHQEARRVGRDWRKHALGRFTEWGVGGLRSLAYVEHGVLEIQGYCYVCNGKSYPERASDG